MKKKRLSEMEWEMLQCSVRYYNGRATIASATFPSRIIKHYYNILTDDQKRWIVTDLKRELKYSTNGRFGSMDVDDLAWKKLLGALDVDRHIRVLLNNGEGCDVFIVESKEMTKYYPLNEYIQEPLSEIDIPDFNISGIAIFTLTRNGCAIYYRCEKERDGNYVSGDGRDVVILSIDEYDDNAHMIH